MRHQSLKICVAVLVIALAVPAANAGDFGVILNQGYTLTDPVYSNYFITALPWFSAPLGENADVYLSAGAGTDYDNGSWSFIYEVYRFELNWNLAPALSLGIGRRNFNDSLGLIMTGLFDGVSATAGINGGRLDMGMFYTGLLFKKTASITMSMEDQIGYHDSDVYFAPRRLAGGVNWEKTSIMDSETNFWFSGIFQVDLNDANVKIHSQYLASKFAFPLGEIGNFGAGAALELIEETDQNFRAAFAVAADFQWIFSGKSQSMLSAGARFSSGDWADGITAFIPLTGEVQGKVLRPNLSGIALVQADYVTRLSEGLFMEAYAAYLFRTDLVHFDTPGMDPASKSPFMGGELYLGFSWSPLSDLIFSLGGGMFLPQMGNVFSGDAGIKYRLEITAGISL